VASITAFCVRREGTMVGEMVREMAREGWEEMRAQ
jgi:hypothetical protein